MVVILFAALVCDGLFFSGTRFRDVTPHPFWLLSIVVAAQYGTASGVMASVLGTLLAYAGNLPARDPLQDQSAYLLSVMAWPVVWFASAVVLGELRLRQDRLNLALRDRVDEQETYNAALTESNLRLESTVERLRAAAAGQVQTTVALFQAAKDVESQSTHSVFESVGPLIHSILSPTSYSVYLKSGNQLDLVVHVNQDKVPDAVKRYAESSALFMAIAQDKKTLHVATAEGQEVLGTEGILAGPLMDVDTGNVVGMLKVEALPMTMLRPDTLQAFRGLCEWIGGAYRKAQAFEEANRSRVNAPGSQLFSDAF